MEWKALGVIFVNKIIYFLFDTFCDTIFMEALQICFHQRCGVLRICQGCLEALRQSLGREFLGERLGNPTVPKCLQTEDIFD